MSDYEAGFVRVDSAEGGPCKSSDCGLIHKAVVRITLRSSNDGPGLALEYSPEQARAFAAAVLQAADASEGLLAPEKLNSLPTSDEMDAAIAGMAGTSN